MTSLPVGSVVLDPAQIATNRTPLQLNSGPIRVGDTGDGTTAIDWGTAQITEYASEQQQWGSSVIDYRVPNRTITIGLLLGADDSGQYETALQQLRQKTALLQREGGWLGRSSSSGQNLYADIVDATLQIPDAYGEEGGFEPDVQLVLTCLPDFYGDLITLDTLSGTGEITTVLTQGGTPAVIAGDYPGRAIIDVVDTSGHTQFGCVWAFQSRYYSAATSAALAYSAGTSGLISPASGASVAALSGARGGEAITQPSVSSSAFTPIAHWLLTHEGTYRCWARVYTASSGVSVQLGWRPGDGSNGLIYGPEVPVPGASAFYLLNLDLVRIPPPSIGTPQWFGEILAEATSGTASVSVDMIYLQPVDENAGWLSGQETTDPVILADLQAALRYDGPVRALAGGSIYSPVGMTFGDLPRIPPSGMEARQVQLLTKPSRGDLQTYPDAGTDSFEATVSYRPAYLFRL